MFDAHTHLNSDQIYPNRQQHVSDFVEVGGTHLITVGIDGVYNTRNIQVCQERLKYPQVSTCIIRSTIGIHPCSVWSPWHTTRSEVDHQMQILQELYEQNTQHIVGVWECGIDAHRWDYDAIKKLQWYAFEQQCLWAQKLNLPIVIHTRSQWPDTLAILQDFKDLKIYLHCRGYTPTEVQQAATALPHLWIGFCGNTTYPKAQPLRDSLTTARAIQNDWWCHVVLETDAPYLSPQSKRGKMNVPAHLRGSATLFAQYIGIPTPELITTASDNSKKLYGL